MHHEGCPHPGQLAGHDKLPMDRKGSWEDNVSLIQRIAKTPWATCQWRPSRSWCGHRLDEYYHADPKPHGASPCGTMPLARPATPRLPAPRTDRCGSGQRCAWSSRQATDSNLTVASRRGGYIKDPEGEDYIKPDDVPCAPTSNRGSSQAIMGYIRKQIQARTAPQTRGEGPSLKS